MMYYNYAVFYSDILRTMASSSDVFFWEVQQMLAPKIWLLVHIPTMSRLFLGYPWVMTPHCQHRFLRPAMGWRSWVTGRWWRWGEGGPGKMAWVSGLMKFLGNLVLVVRCVGGSSQGLWFSWISRGWGWMVAEYPENKPFVDLFESTIWLWLT